MNDIHVIWDLDDEPDGHIAEHGLTAQEVEDVLFAPDSQTTTSRTSGLNVTFGYTFAGEYIAVVWEHILDDPRTLRPITAYQVPERRRRSR